MRVEHAILNATRQPSTDRCFFSRLLAAAIGRKFKYVLRFIAGSIPIAALLSLNPGVPGGAPSSAEAVVPTAPDTGPDLPACVRYRGEARYRNYGYDHYVIIDNRCDRTALCAVTTDVNPDPVSVTVLAREQAEVLTFRGSPASSFTARLRCSLQR